MRNLFKRHRNECPVDEETRIWMENSLIWLMNQFSEEFLLKEKTLTPTDADFPVKLDHTEQSAFETLKIISSQMMIDPQSIDMNFYHQSPLHLNTGFGNTLITKTEENESTTAGLYHGRQEDLRFAISIEYSQFLDIEKLIATIAHELAHIKIVGEQRLKENDENLIDLTTVFFGLGIFGANAAFKFHSTQNTWGYSNQGYFIQQEWGYALALYAYIRNETNPQWLKYVTKNVQSDFKKSMSYILENTDKVLV